MPKFTVKKIENLSDAEVNEYVQLYCDLMQTDKATMIMAGGDLTSLKLQSAAVIRAGALAGEFYKAVNEKGEMVGYALWTPPGEELVFSKPEHRALGFTESIARLSAEDQKFFKEQFMVHHPHFIGSHLGPTGRKDSWWLLKVAVRPEYQRQGIFRALFTAVHEKASRAGDTIACTTTSDSNVPIFVALGFTLNGTKVYKAPSGDWTSHLLSLNPGK